MSDLTSPLSCDLDRGIPMNSEVMNTDVMLAAIDVGTNSIHMVVAKIQPDIPAFTIIARDKSTVRLGDRDLANGNLTPASIDRALIALKRCQEIAKSLNATDIIAVATSAVREAPNGNEFLAQVEAELGLSINLIAGSEEARRIYLGVLSGMSLNEKPHLIIDIGGGSTELILGDGHEARSLSSTKIGAVRLTREYVTTDPISNTEFIALQAYIRGMLERPIEDIRSKLNPSEVLRLVGTSGTIESLAILQARETLGTVPSPLNGYEFTLQNVTAWIEKLRRMKYADRLAIPGMNDRRAEIILAGAMILQEVMVQLKLVKLRICERSLREGVIVDWMITHGLIENRLRFQASVRERSVYKNAKKFNVKLEHSDRVAKFALQLFDQTQNWLHFWEAEERELLWAAAILHNCGHHINHGSHHKHSYYLIRNAELLGYTENEINTIANLARYHRKSNPKKQKHDCYKSLSSPRERKIVDQLSPLLRLAVALDRRQIGAVDRFEFKYDPMFQTATLEIYPKDENDPCALELWNLDYKKSNFERTFRITLNAKLITNAMS
jgi:exopolyphosphatase / guanosine-5'-triphosphate,3'-diphosphate pyrophosphatase